MRKRFIHLSLLLIITSLFVLSACGSRGGAPGADSGDTGILIQSVSIVGEEPAGGDNEIDAALHLCPPDFTELEDGLFMANATITIDAAPTGFSDVFPASIEECTITYLKGIENPDAPIIESLTIFPNCIIVEDDTNECNVVMMDVDRKVKFWDDLNNLNFTQTRPVHYVVRYECDFVNTYGESGGFQVEYDIWLDDWDYC